MALLHKTLGCSVALCKVKVPFCTEFYLSSWMASTVFLCGKCRNEVEDEQDGVQCEGKCAFFIAMKQSSQK